MQHQQFKYNCTTLVQMVEKYPVIWDRTNGDYRNKQLKEKSWVEIFRALEPDFEGMSAKEQIAVGNMIRDKWCNIRDTMVRYLRMRSQRADTKRYHFADVCHFLEKMYCPSKMYKFYPPDQQDSYSEFDPNIQNVVCILGEGEDGNGTDAEGRDDEAKVKTEIADEDRQETANGDDFNDSTSEADYRPPPKKRGKRSHAATPSKSQKFEYGAMDEDEAFFVSVLPHVRELSSDEKIDFRMGVLKMIKDAKKRNS